jgi:hypothetical protein
MAMRFGLDRHPISARMYAAAVMLLLPPLFPLLFCISYAPEALRTFWSDLTMNYRNAWEILSGEYHKKQRAAAALGESK